MGQILRKIFFGLGVAACAALPVLAAAAPPPAVGVAAIAQQNVAPSYTNLGHVVAIQTVKIVPRVTGFIEAVNFKRGSEVAQGQLLFTLQKAQYQAALQTAQANLASAQAALQNADLAYQRAARLRSTGFEAQSNLDTALATRNEDKAKVLSAQASVATAALDLGYCTISAPIAGRIGATKLTKGNLVTPTSGTLATINQLNPIRVEFSVSTDSPILTAAQGGEASMAKYALTIDLPNGKPYPLKGRISFLDNQVNTATGTVNVYADFPNPNGTLLPGAYVNVRTAPAQPKEALVVPVAAVQTDQKGNYVLIVGQNNKVSKRDVTLGPQIGEDYIVKSGAALGQRVIVDGIQKVKAEQAVAPQPEASTPASSGASGSGAAAP
jgi:membrane fusion protein (multidrug efflux system)